MNKAGEADRLQEIAYIHETEALAGANEQYHVYLRDLVIPSKGGRSALEIGCGKRLWTKVLCDRYDIVDVVDASRDLLKQATLENINHRAKLTTHAVLVEDFRPAIGQQWQHIYMTFLLEHVLDPVAVLKQIKGCLSEDGRLFLATPNANSVHRILAVRMGLIESVDELSDNDKRVGHRRVYTLELLRSQCIEAGLRIVKEEHIGLKVVSLKQMEDWPSRMVEVFCASGDLMPASAAYITMECTRS